MTEARKIYRRDREIGTEVTDAELRMMSADALIEAIRFNYLNPFRIHDGQLVLINMAENDIYVEGEYPATKLHFFDEEFDDYDLMGTQIEDDEFYALSADEMREAIVARSDDTYFFRDSGGDLIIVSKDEF